MNITVVGNNSSNELKLIKNIRRALETLSIDNNINITDNNQKYNIKNAPALIINNNIVSEGKVLNEREIVRFIRKYA